MDAIAPLRLQVDLRLRQEHFARVCAENRQAVQEIDVQGWLIPMRPTGSETGLSNGELFFEPKLFATVLEHGKGLDSSTGFQRPDGSVFRNNATLLRLDRWQALSPEERKTPLYHINGSCSWDGY